MRIKKLVMQAFGPFKDRTEIDFEKNNLESGIVLITGETGAGKTSVFDGVCYALYGKASGNSREKISLRSDFASDDVDTVVTLDFEHQGKNYQITRGAKMARRAGEMKPVDFLEFEINGRKLTKVKEVDDAVKGLIGLEYEQFCQVAMLAQGEFSRFLLAGPDEKTKIFRKIFNSDIYDKFVTGLREEAKACGSIRNSRLSVLNSEKEKLQDIDYRQYTDETLLEVISEKIKSEKAETEKRKKNRDALNQEKEKLHTEYEKQRSINEDIDALEKVRKQLAELSGKSNEIEKDRKILEYNRNAVTEIEKVLVLQENTAKQLDNNRTALEENSKKLETVKTRLRENAREFARLETYVADRDRLQDLSRELTKLQEKYQEHKRINEQIAKESDKLMSSLREYEKADQLYIMMEKHYYGSRAYMLSQRLKDNEPCPVCGSLHHPDIAKAIEGDVTVRQLGKQRDTVQKLNSANEGYRTRIDGLKEQLEKLDLPDDVNVDEALKEAVAKNEKVKNDINLLAEHNKKFTDLKKSLDDQQVSLNSLISNENEAIKTLEEKLKEIAESLQKALDNHHTDLQEYGLNKKSNNELRLLEGKVKKYDTDYNIYSGNQEVLEKRVEGKEKTDLSRLSKQYSDKEEEYESADKQYSLLSGKLLALENNLKNLRKYVRDYREADSKYRMVSDLSAIASGTKAGTQRIDFENYVLSYYLNNVLVEANNRLARMTDNRYALLRKDTSERKSEKLGLQFAVFDALTNKERDVGSLSGGEKFKASLSLALGLSDVISMYAGGIRLDCLFVDEGFGSLDRNSLDQAMNTLMELADGDKLVAIISHVSELENRIDRKIIVTKSTSGSHIRIQS